MRVPREGGRSDVRSELVEMLLELKEKDDLEVRSFLSPQAIEAKSRCSAVI